MRAARGLGFAFVFFAASFALHIVGGATDQGWLFAIAVALIYVAATGFPAIALAAAGLTRSAGWQARLTLGVGTAAGLVFTLGALWAANGRAFAWQQFPLAPLLALVSSFAILRLRRLLPFGTSGGGASELAANS